MGESKAVSFLTVPRCSSSTSLVALHWQALLWQPVKLVKPQMTSELFELPVQREEFSPSLRLTEIHKFVFSHLWTS